MSALLIAQLTAIATEAASVSTHPCTQPIVDPVAFLTHLFWYLSNTVQPITRTGMDRMMDALFVPSGAFESLLDNPDHHQAIVATSVSQMSDLFKAHWKHIIIPAWNQHAEIRRVCNQSR
jgi:hypothetical protein